MLNNITADVVDFAACRTFEKFKEHTDLLNKLESYPQLLHRVEKIGFDFVTIKN
jgi:hypothetical protein